MLQFFTGVFEAILLLVLVRGIAGCYEDVVEFRRLGREIKVAQARIARARREILDAHFAQPRVIIITTGETIQ